MKPLVIGMLGFALAWGGWHAFEDHQRVHALDATLAQLAVGPDGTVRLRTPPPPPPPPTETPPAK